LPPGILINGIQLPGGYNINMCDGLNGDYKDPRRGVRIKQTGLTSIVQVN